MKNQKEEFDFSYSIDNEENAIYFYYIIRKNMGTKIKIKLPDYIKDTAPILSNLISYYGKNIEDFDKICLELLDNLPGNLHMYPEIVILYDNSNKDVLGNVDIDELDNYNGDMFIMHNGKLDKYFDSKHRIGITGVLDLNNKVDYLAYIVRSSNACECIPSLYESDSNSPYVIFGKEFISELDAIRTKKVKRKTRTKKDAK